MMIIVLSSWQRNCKSSFRSFEWKSVSTRWPPTRTPSYKL